MSFIISTEPSGGSVSIGGTVTGGNNNDVLFINPAEVLAQDDTFTFEAGKLTAPRISSIDGLFEFPDGSIQSDGEQVLRFFNFIRITFDSALLTEANILVDKLGIINTGGNTSVGFAALTAGTVDIANTDVTNAACIVIISPKTSSLNTGNYSVVITDNVGFTINSSNVLDDNEVSFMVVYTQL